MPKKHGTTRPSKLVIGRRKRLQTMIKNHPHESSYQSAHRESIVHFWRRNQSPKNNQNHITYPDGVKDLPAIRIDPLQKSTVKSNPLINSDYTGLIKTIWRYWTNLHSMYWIGAPYTVINLCNGEQFSDYHPLFSLKLIDEMGLPRMHVEELFCSQPQTAYSTNQMKNLTRKIKCEHCIHWTKGPLQKVSCLTIDIKYFKWV